ncbi:kexin [Entomortierella parvispora]|uniref:Kexin n=1 Tax=Entomortierella parvispora TaxID=205924 RepID=A0A9P3H6N1_9FUNG|nr:kexin [Entomortierella parvispora]
MQPTLLLMGAMALAGTWSSSVVAVKQPHLHDNDNFHYYAIKLNDPATAPLPHELAGHLGVQYLGQVGELANYHLFSYPKTMHEKRSDDYHRVSANATFTTEGEYQDIVLQRYHDLKQSKAFHLQLLRKRGVSGNDGANLSDEEEHPLGQIEKQSLRKRVKRILHAALEPRDEHTPGEQQPPDGMKAHLQLADPGFVYQWHLHNTLQPGNDINVTGVWDQGVTGKGALVAIIDDGLDAYSEDLAPNFYKLGSHDFNDNQELPLPKKFDDNPDNHGTRCAGEIASARNNLCGVGVAWDAKVAGIRILSEPITDVQEAEALNYGYNETQIYSCSWGPTDDGKTMDGPTGMLLDAFVNGITNGRGGKGSIYVFATGNGGRYYDNCNFDGYANSRYTVSIGAITRTNQHPVYSEACSAQLGVTYSSGDNSWIYTCDVGKRNCFNRHSGTSAAAPIAAGIFALVLEVRPDLNWRDIQHLTILTAVPIDETDTDWTETAVGRLFNHKYGYGSLDAYAMVEAAKTWVSVPEQVSYESPVIRVEGDIPSGVDDASGHTGELGLPSVFLVTKEATKNAKIASLEHVTVTVNIQHTFRGEVEVELTSPNRIVSKLAVARPLDASTDGFVNWTFMSVKHWDEDPVGAWTLTVYDRTNATNTGTFLDWKLGLHGAIEAGQTAPPPPPPVKPPPAQPTTSAAIPAPTSQPEEDGRVMVHISPFIYVMFAGMFVAIGAALFLMHRQRTNPRNIFGSARDDEEAGQRGGLLGRRGDYEFDELPTHELGGSDDDEDDDDDVDPDSRRILFDRSNLVDDNGHEDSMTGMKEAKSSSSAPSSPFTNVRDTIPSPLSSGEEIERESSFEVAERDDDGEDDDEYDEDDDFEDHPGGAGKKVRGDWDEFSSLVKTKDGQGRR